MLLLLVGTANLYAQGGPFWVPHVPFVQTPPEVAETMLRLARVGPSDIVYDLGSGDGRIVVAAAAGFGARSVGVEIDAGLIRRALDNAAAAGVRSRASFVRGDLMYADVSEATVVTMYLLPSINDRLRPRLLTQLRPGTRIVTHTFDFAGWEPDARATVAGVPVYLWTVPRTTPTRGRVSIADGSPLPLSTELETVCAGRVRFEGYAAPDGTFSIPTLPRGERGTAAVRQDDAAGCRIRAVLPGYRSDTVPLAGGTGVVTLTRASQVPGTLVGARSRTTGAAAAVAAGREAFSRGALDAAVRAFERAVRADAGDPGAWFHLGLAEAARGEFDRARTAYTRAIGADALFVGPFLGLTQIAVHENDWARVAELTGSLLKLDSENFPEAYLYHAVGCLTLGRSDEAERSARAAVLRDPGNRFPRARYVLALALVRKGDTASAAEECRAYIAADPRAPDIAEARKLLSTLLVRAER